MSARACVQSMCAKAPEPLQGTVSVDQDETGHTDTYLSRQTFSASLKAAGAVQEAVRRVANGINRHVYIVNRKPGASSGGCLWLGLVW